MILILLLFCYGLLDHATAASINFQKILEAKSLLVSLGVSETNLCRNDDPKIQISNPRDPIDDIDYLWLLPLCNDRYHESVGRKRDDHFEIYDPRRLAESEDEEISFVGDPRHFIINALCAICCVVTAALASGLTMGLLTIDPLMLLVKIRAAHSDEEKAQAEAILPVVKQQHLLLVFLLLVTSLANEALPVFLEKLASPIVSVLFAIIFSLIFGEIIPSAVFTGPKKLQYAANMIEARYQRWLGFNTKKGLPKKRQRKIDKMNLANLNKRSEKEHKFPHPKARHVDLENVLKAAKSESIRMTARDSLSDVQSIHMDEVMMVEGALQMKTKTTIDMFTPLNRMFAVPENLILNEDSVVDIFSSGYSRIPVYEQNPLKPNSQTSIKGILIAKHLIVVNMSEERPLLTMPLLIPPYVSPKMNLVQLANLFQTGRSGHFALVCARPNVANVSLRNGNAVPAEAGVMRITTLEDVLEELLQEKIHDENDQMEKEVEKIALWVVKKWKNKLQRRKEGKSIDGFCSDRRRRCLESE